MKGDITLEGDKDATKRNKNLAFKNNAPFINCISKINGVKIRCYGRFRCCNALV